MDEGPQIHNAVLRERQIRDLKKMNSVSSLWECSIQREKNGVEDRGGC
jgi:hypothetical protein